MVGIDTAIIQHPKTWEASGHVAGFADPMVDDKETKERFRADHLMAVTILPAKAASQVEVPALLDSLLPTKTIVAGSPGEATILLAEDKKLAKRLGIRSFEATRLVHAGALTLLAGKIDVGDGPRECIIHAVIPRHLREQPTRVPSPFTGKEGSLTEPRQFGLMLGTKLGAVDPMDAYLRPETAQGIFLNFKNVLDTTRVKVPFGVAQIGKSFRNEVTPRNFIFRSREFEQMEMEWFCPPDDAAQWYEFWKAQRMAWWRSLGISAEKLRFRDHTPDELSFYSKMTVDIEYQYPFTAPDFGELEGIAHRGDYDLTQHAKHSGLRLDYFDQELQLKLKEQGVPDEQVKARSRYVPNVIEPASGLTRAVLVLLCEAYTPDPSRPSQLYMKFKPRFAPVKLGIFPLVNKDGMPEIAEKLYLDLRADYVCEYDPKQAIGKRYARMDEIGTPYCVTIDGQTAQDQTVTVRHRDDCKQERIALDKVRAFLLDHLDAESRIASGS
jgi:glycyl-tRNA synthetase